MKSEREIDWDRVEEIGKKMGINSPEYKRAREEYNQKYGQSSSGSRSFIDILGDLANGKRKRRKDQYPHLPDEDEA